MLFPVTLVQLWYSQETFIFFFFFSKLLYSQQGNVAPTESLNQILVAKQWNITVLSHGNHNLMASDTI